MTQYSPAPQNGVSVAPYDFIAIGIGPFNLGLACLTQPLKGVNALFIDQNTEFNWHPGMMLESAHLQTPFMADLVTLADPTHPLSFLNYIKQQGRIYSFYIRENFFLMRKEYNQYCQWAASRLNNLRFNTRAERIDFDAQQQCYRVTCSDTRTGQPLHFLARRLVLGTGPHPAIPDCCLAHAGRMTHAADYLSHKETLQTRRSITVVGSGQSAAEIFYDLLGDIDEKGYQLNWLTRAPRFFPMEYTKLTLEMTSPEYVDYFHALPAAKRDELNRLHQPLYKGINGSLINAIFDLLYIKRLNGELNVNMFTNTALVGVAPQANGKALTLSLHQHEQDSRFTLNSEGVVLCTGYRHSIPAFLEGIRDRIVWDEQGRYDVARNYSIDHSRSGIFVQNVGPHTHSFVTPDLGMACYRNAWLLREMTGTEHYPIEERIAFQQFSAPPTGVVS
ncbi:lysine/ornithine N-monooxygenase [Enterobacillus tribolii]|uniref:Lysine/ornithine N-monooxygenase n=1 Tax=Enterobacillus tribolii TaxID=1487935 RepID=A0A370QQ85_9GAMM|nr:alcaligin biosynthesis protein [Enterobacillus tribolii]RDK90941.1 lysine/ornithine N-monooxygenase [Enterobacillus tribolii]